MSEALFWRTEAERHAPGEPEPPVTPFWRLSAGTHDGTMESRDSGSEPYSSEEAAMDAWAEREQAIAAAGYLVWFATLTPPEGSGLEPRTLHPGVPYF